MPRRSNIKWRQQDKETISKTVRQFNAKLTRILKKHPELAPYLPDRLTVEGVRQSIETRQDFNREVRSLQRFLKRGAERPILSDSGIKTTEWQRREVGYKVATVNRARTLEAKRANVSTEKGTMGSIEANNLRPKSYDINRIAPRDWNKFIETVERQVMTNYDSDRVERYKENYLKSIRRNLGTRGKAKELYDLVATLDPYFMYDIYYDDPVLQIQFTSDPLPAELIAEQALEHWLQMLGR